MRTQETIKSILAIPVMLIVCVIACIWCLYEHLYNLIATGNWTGTRIL